MSLPLDVVPTNVAPLWVDLIKSAERIFSSACAANWLRKNRRGTNIIARSIHISLSNVRGYNQLKSIILFANALPGLQDSKFIRPQIFDGLGTRKLPGFSLSRLCHKLPSSISPIENDHLECPQWVYPRIS